MKIEPLLAEKTKFSDQYNTRFYTCVGAMEKFIELDNELLAYQPYSPASSPSDSFLLLNIKKGLHVKWFASSDEIVNETNIYFQDLDNSYYFKGVKELGKRSKWK